MSKKRIQALRDELTSLNIDALLVTESKNIRYLSGFTGTTAVLLISTTEAFFITDFRYVEQAHQQAKNYQVVIHQNGMYNQVNDLINQLNINKLGFEGSHLTVNQYEQLADLFDVDFVATMNVIESLREIKDASEIALIQKSAEIMDKAYSHILDFIQVGMTEWEVANELERFCKELGASSMSFDTIVASGVRAAMPHGVASHKKIDNNEIITLDFGCYYEGYTADMTRTFAIGEIDPKLKEIYQIVYDAQALVNQQVQVGLTGKEIDAIARDYITEHGYGKNFGHSTGHGIGLDIHENPSISAANTQPIVVGNVITNEPGIYIEGLGGVRIEDDIVMGEKGATVINQSPKELIIL